MSNRINDNESNLSNNDKGYHYLFKVILIGDSGTGKTSILNKYINGIFTEKHLCTIGVDFLMKTIKIDDCYIKLQIWDTAGMERYKQITTSYYRGANSAIIVFDLSNKETFLSLCKWINLYHEYSNPNISKIIVIIGNKSDIDKREVSYEEIQEVLITNPSILYYETSAKNGDNIQIVFESIVTRLYKEYTRDNKSKVINKERNGSYVSINNFEVEPFKNKKKCKC